MSFGFREPYQVLGVSSLGVQTVLRLTALSAVDGEMVLDSCRFKMELEPALSRTLHGTVKPSTSTPGLGSENDTLTSAVITQCEIRKLYARKDEPGVSEAIELAKTCERRRCGHHPEEYPEPLGTMDCLGSVVDPKDKGENKHRYVVASHSQDVRRMLRGIRGVPLIYIRRSVMILEPMSDESAQMRAREERGKFRAEIKTALGKRKREEKKDAHENGPRLVQAGNGDAAAAGVADRPRNKKRGPKGPNPLSVKKSKKKTPANTKPVPKAEAPAEVPSKGKRRRKDDSGMGAANGEAQDARPTDAKAD